MSRPEPSQLPRDAFEQASTGGGALVCLENRFGIRVTGSDAERYLSGQLTNDLALTTSETAVYTCVTNAKGKLEADAWVRRESDGSFLIDADSSLRGTLPARLERYAIADDVEFAEVDLPELWHVTGIPTDLPDDAIKAKRFGLAGIDLAGVPTGATAELPRLDTNQADALRIIQGLPAWGAELTDGLLPPEAGIESIAVSYDKGCYIGQEVISRMRRAGKTNRILVYLVSSYSPGACFDLPASLAGLSILDSTGQSVGEVTSSTIHPILDRWVALAYVKTRSLASEPSQFAIEGPDSRKPSPFEQKPAPYTER